MAGSTKNDNKQQGKAQGYMKYSGMAFQIAAYIIVGLFLGKQLDNYLETERPVFSALGAILFLIAYFIKLVIDLNKNKL